MIRPAGGPPARRLVGIAVATLAIGCGAAPAAEEDARAVLTVLVVATIPAGAQESGVDIPAEVNVVYGMVSGGALLMDVHRPARSNGAAILFVPGSGWHAPAEYGAHPLKGRSSATVARHLGPLTEAGFTVFVVNHRAAPVFHHPDALHDVQRATRFIRHHAARWGIDPDRIGAVGHSSGGHLVTLLGTLPGDGEPEARDPVERESARVHAVAAGAAPVDFQGAHVHYAGQRADRDENWLDVAIFGAETMTAYLGQRCIGGGGDQRICIEASPLAHVSADDPPFLLVHGDRDFLIPISHSEVLRDSLRAVGAEAELIAVRDGGHDAFPLERVAAWLAERMGRPGGAPAAAAEPAGRAERVDADIVYGMVSGLALLMDVHRPERSNGRPVLFVAGSGWHALPTYGSGQLKGSPPDGHAEWVKPLTDAGYTVFAINHRNAPRFRWPAALEDAQRAVRFIRHHAARWGVDPSRIGAVGSSSGGHLVSLLGTADLPGDPDAEDPVERHSAEVQAVVAIQAPTTMTEFDGAFAISHVVSFMGAPAGRTVDSRYTAASASRHVTPDDAPFLLIHGDADDIVPFRQSEMMLEALRAAGVPAELVRRAGRGHERIGLEGAVPWLDRYLGTVEAR